MAVIFEARNKPNIIRIIPITLKYKAEPGDVSQSISSK